MQMNLGRRVSGVSIVVPCYLKQDVVQPTLIGIAETLRSNGFSFEIITVLDGSPDLTEERIRQIQDEAILVYSYQRNRGKGFALKFGALRAKFDFIVFADADPDLSPEHIPQLIDLLVENNAAAAIGSKVHPESKVEYPKSRRAQSAAYRRLNQVLFGLSVSDTQTGLKAFRRAPLLEALELTTIDRFAFDLDLLVRLHDGGYAIVEGPIQLSYSFSSTVSISASFRILADTISLAIRRRSPQKPNRRRENAPRMSGRPEANSESK